MSSGDHGNGHRLLRTEERARYGCTVSFRHADTGEMREALRACVIAARASDLRWEVACISSPESVWQDLTRGHPAHWTPGSPAPLFNEPTQLSRAGLPLTLLAPELTVRR